MAERMWALRVSPSSALLKQGDQGSESSLMGGMALSDMPGGQCDGDGMPGEGKARQGECNVPSSCWEDLPELALALVVQQLAGKSLGDGERKALFAAAGVCHSWRVVALREITKHLWDLGQSFLHPVQLLQLSPQAVPGRHIKCILHREVLSRGLFTKRYLYSLYLEEPRPGSTGLGKFLLSAMQHTWQSLSVHFSHSDWKQPCAKLHCNAWGNQYKMEKLEASYFQGVSGSINEAGPCPMGAIAYRIKWKNLARVRQWDLFMHVHLPPANEDVPAVKLINNPPRWNQGLKCFSLDFRGRVKLPSVKNFQLLHHGKPSDEPVMQFGKVATDAFILDFDPTVMSTFQAFSIALASFEAT